MAISPEEFARLMRDVYPENGVYDPEGAHDYADSIMCDILKDLGYHEGVEIFTKAKRWYV